ncbi:MAG: tyrosine-type recombinase/integrase [Deltaproteobacteria bacterium]|nr:tyrosine-type recombinase/integrase [Deltaproteobacteria bacterium]
MGRRRRTERKTERTVRMTERLLGALPSMEDGRDKVEWSDVSTTGLRFVQAASGKGRWMFRYTLGGRKCSMTLGPYPAVPLADARKKVLEAQAKVARGENPAEEVEKRKADVTLAAFVEEHFWPHQKSAKRSWKDDVWAMEKRILPALGKRRLRDITKLDVVGVRNAVREATSEPTANRHLCCLARALSLAHQWGFIDANPAKGVERFREVARRENFLTPDQTRRLDDTLAGMSELAVPAGCARLLLWTGLRRGEAAGMRWEDVTLDGDAPSAFLPRTKSGRSRTVPLNTMAVAVLRGMEAHRLEGNPHVFPSTASKSGHVRDLRVAWKRAKKQVGLSADLHLHDLRHSYASAVVSSGNSLYAVQKLLGHAAPTMTQRYAHLADATLREASEAAVSRAAQGGR